MALRVQANKTAPLLNALIGHVRVMNCQHNADEQDICQEVAVQLLTRLWEIWTNPALPPIDNFRSYVFTSAQNACYKRVRTNYPAWWRLKNRIRYVLNHKPQFATWSEQSGQTVCGLAGWEERMGASSEANLSRVDLSEFPSKPGRTALGPAGLAEVMQEFLTWHARPVLLDNLVNAMAEICAVREPQFVGTSAEPGDISAESLRDCSLNPAGQLEQKVYLQRLWQEICELPLNQRLALLLNMRDGSNSEAVILFTQTGTTTVRGISTILNIEFQDFVELWNYLPLDDNTIAARLGLTRQQIINLRKSARERLARRMLAVEKRS